jgi:predicted dehydrogenase
MIKFAVIGIDHRHVYHLIGELLKCGAVCAGYWTVTTNEKVRAGIQEKFPSLPEFDDKQALLQDATISLIVTAAVPSQRADIALEAMHHGKDVLCDKPGITSYEQLWRVQEAVRETGKIFSICFSERMVVPSVGKALALVRQGAIGRVIQTQGTGPHRLNKAIRPEWFFDKDSYGGILVDIASHQIDQFLTFTNSDDAHIESAMFGHYGLQTPQTFQDFGEVVLASSINGSRGYIRVDWFTPDGLPTWGDGRLFVLGTEGYIELRKYIDVQGRSGTDHLLMVNHEGSQYLHCEHEPLDFFAKLITDIEQRTETAMTQKHVFLVCKLALDADKLAQTRSGS